MVSTTTTDYAFIVALKEEFAVLAASLDITFSPTHVGTEFAYRFSFRDVFGHDLTGIAVLIDDMGNTESAVVTATTIAEYHPRVVVSLGLSGALSSDVRLCDVVVASEVEEYSHRGKAVPDVEQPGGFDLEFGGKSRECTLDVAKRISSLEFSRAVEFAKWGTTARQDQISRLGKHSVEALRNSSLIRSEPNIHLGPEASGPYVGASREFVAFLRTRNRNFLALDMEAAGVLAAASRHHEITRVVFRVISDFSDDRKKELDDKYKGQVRASAVAAGMMLMKFLLNESLLLTPHFVQPVQVGSKSLRDLASDLYDLARLYFQPKDPLAITDRKKLNRLYKHVISCPKQPDIVAADDMFDAIVQLALNTTHRYPVQLQGLAGSGKTLFLQALYSRLREIYDSNPDAPIPAFIDLKHYDDLTHEPSQSKAAIIALQNHLAPLRELCERFPKQPIVLIVDSVDHHAGHRSALETEVARVIQRTPATKKIISVGSVQGTKSKRHLPSSFSDPFLVMHLDAVRSGTSEANDFIKTFLEIYSTDRDRAHLLQKWLSQFKLEELDVLTLSMLYRKTANVSYDQISTISDFYALYCDDYLRDMSPNDTPEVTLVELSRAAHKHFVRQQNLTFEGPQLLAAWKLLHYHQGVRDYLIANHIINTLVTVGQGDSSAIADLDFVYPQNVNRFCKEIMTADPQTELQCVAGGNAVVDQCKAAKKVRLRNALTHVCYLAGRVRSPEAKDMAHRFLDERRLEHEQSVKPLERRPGLSGTGTKSRLLLHRTIYISLAYLGDRDAARQYIARLLKNPDWDNLNRGFHLEYYSDIAYIPDSEQMAHVDELKPFPNTYAALSTRIKSAVRPAGNRNLFEIEFYTMLSLAQHRHAEGLLDTNTRKEVLALIHMCNGTIRDGLLRSYADMMLRNLEGEAFPVGTVIELLYRLKDERRRGWVSRNVPKPTESVADHTFGALLIGKLFLPDAAPSDSASWKGYDKAEVLRQLFVHDLAEAFTGDLLPEDRDDTSHQKEAESFSYLEMLGTYRSLYGLASVQATWEAFDRRADINAKIANDIDKLENLVQLYIYRKQNKPIPGFDLWKRDLAESIKTDAGQAILDIIKNYFDRL